MDDIVDPREEDYDRPPRPVVIPAVTLPVGLAMATAWALVAAAALTVVAALVSAIAYEPPGLPANTPAVGYVNLFAPVSFGDRVTRFADSAASLTVAVLMVLAVLVVTMAGRFDAGRSRPGRRWPPPLVIAGAVGAIVVMANVVTGIEILSNATHSFGPGGTSKLSGVLNLLAPTLTALAATTYGVIWQRASVRETPAPRSG